MFYTTNNNNNNIIRLSGFRSSPAVAATAAAVMQYGTTRTADAVFSTRGQSGGKIDFSESRFLREILSTKYIIYTVGKKITVFRQLRVLYIYVHVVYLCTHCICLYLYTYNM